MIKIKKIVKRNVKKIGPDRDDFEVEVVSVKIQKTLRDRCHDAVWTAAAAVIGATVATVIIIPMFG